MTRQWLTLALVGVILALAIYSPNHSVQAYPTPAIVSKAWEFEFSFNPPRAIAITKLDGSTQWYWYVTYKVINQTGEDRVFLPEVTVATDEGDIIPANKNVPLAVFEAIKKQLNHPLLESPSKVVGKILQGPDYARESVAIWPAFEHDVNQMSLFIGGLSGETQVVKDPQTDKDVLLGKTLMMDFDMLGRPSTPQEQKINLLGKRWVMR